jgi:hypothetical protein
MSDQNRDLYRWSEGQDASCNMPRDSQVTTRFRDEVYDQRMAQPRQFSYRTDATSTSLSMAMSTSTRAATTCAPATTGARSIAPAV